jgi:hypothetical protein
MTIHIIFYQISHRILFSPLYPGLFWRFKFDRILCLCFFYPLFFQITNIGTIFAHNIKNENDRQTTNSNPGSS